jgi:hypothetical protein
MAHGNGEREDARRRWEQQRAKYVWGPGNIQITKKPGEADEAEEERSAPRREDDEGRPGA